MSAMKDYLIDQIERIARENHYSFELIYQCYMELRNEAESDDPLGEVERMAREQDLDECYLEFCNPCYF